MCGKEITCPALNEMMIEPSTEWRPQNVSYHASALFISILIDHDLVTFWKHIFALIMYSLVLLTIVFLIFTSLDSQCSPCRCLRSSENGSPSTQDMLNMRMSGHREQRDQGALGLPVSGKLFAERTHGMEMSCLSDQEEF